MSRELSRREALALAAGASLVSLPSRADECPPDRIDRALQEIAQARAAVKTLTGPFTQQRTIGLLATKVTSTGTLTLVRPDRLRWELAPPDDAIYWIVPEGLAYKSKAGEGHMAAGSGTIAAALDDLRTLLGGDLAGLRARYDLSGVCDGGAVTSFQAVPKAGQAGTVKRIDFSLAADLVSPKSVVIVEGPKDRTEIVFGAMQKNVAVDPARMRPPS